MAPRLPLCRIDGATKELPPGDTLNTNARFNGSAAVPAITLLGTSSVNLDVTPVLTGDALAVGEPVNAYATAVDLPAGVVLGQARVIAKNRVKLTFSAVVAIAASSAIAWTIVAHR